MADLNPETQKSIAPEKKPLWFKLLAELFGTFILVFFGVLIGVMFNSTSSTDNWAKLTAICLVWGLTVTALCYAIGGISGCQLNPSVSIAMALDKRMTWKEFALYVIAQVIGATLAGLLAVGIFRDMVGNVASTTVNAAAFALADTGAEFIGAEFIGLILECLVTAVFVYFILVISADAKYSKISGLAIGLILWLAIAVLFNFTGGSLNAARSLGTALSAMIVGEFDPIKEIWVYIVGPTLGGVVAFGFYKLFNKSKLAKLA